MSAYLTEFGIVHAGASLYSLAANTDFTATHDSYDADCDQDGFHSNHPIGFGRTELEALDDLIEQLGEAA